MVLVLLFSSLCQSSFTIILMEKRLLVALLFFLMSCDSQCSVALPRDALGLVCGV